MKKIHLVGIYAIVFIVIFILYMLIPDGMIISEDSRSENNNTNNGYNIVETLDLSCKVDTDCKTPMHYMVQSHCPYDSKCINSKCSVICPSDFTGRKISENEMQVPGNPNQINMDQIVKPDFDYKGILKDVTGGKIVTGINTKGNSVGVAMSKFNDGKYELLATFKGLPDPQGTDFYEGWIVKKGLKFDVLSTGKLIKENGEYKNLFEDNIDLTDHDFYVLTIEPDDGNPEPAEHILEGTMDMVK